jgi:LEA14-like dessication related protein
MMNYKIWLQCIFFGGLFLLGVSCQKAVAPEYLGFQNLLVNKMTAQEYLLSANVKFYNPNHFNLEMKRAELDIFLNQKLADHYLLDSTIFIPKTDTFYVPVSLKVNLSNIFTNALQMLLSNSVHIMVDGKVKLKRGGITITRPFHYEGAQKLDSLLNLSR